VYSPWLVMLSIVLAMVISYVALQLAFGLREDRTSGGWRKFGSAVAMGSALPVMHYVGMAAASFYPAAGMADAYAVSVSSVGLASITAITLVLLCLVLLSSLINRRFAIQELLLTDSQLQLQAVFDNMTEGVLVMDGEGKTLLMNKAAAGMLSMPDGSDRYQDVADQFEAFAPDGTLLPAEQWPTGRALRGDFVQRFEILYRRRSTGELGAREISTAPMRNALGEPGNVIITYRDTTERRKMDEVRRQLAAIVESSEDAIIGKDLDGRITSWNEGAHRTFGYTAEEMLGQPIAMLLPADRLEEETDILSRIRRGETAAPIETLRRTKSGKFIHVSLAISPILDPSGRVIGASKIARNISERKKLESQLYQSQKMEAIGQLTGGIAHDFNNLLGVVLGNLDLLERLVPDNEKALKRVGTAQKAAERGADLTRRLLKFSSSVELKSGPTHLHHSVRNVLELAQSTGDELKLSASLDEDLSMVLMDAAGFESALLNLIVNARDAMPNGGSLTISTQLKALDEGYPLVLAGELKAGSYACVSVSDTGIGMSKETMERVFEPFFTTKPRGKGTGLGLAMVYGFAKQSGGAVGIYSEPGHGTTVALYLRLAGDAAAPVRAATQRPLRVKHSCKVLVVDDNKDLLEIAMAYLGEMGHTAYQAADGASALAIVDQHRDFDLLVTDVIMPGGMNGAELAQKVREVLPHIKIVYSSGFPADSLAERSMPLVDGYLLYKPYQLSEFGAAVRQALE
jgi:PAS domain S-box-containing protein